MRFGRTGSEESFMDPDPPTLDESATNSTSLKPRKMSDRNEHLSEHMTPRDGQVSIYANKPVLGF